jgi:hypothetical protein
MQRGMLGRSSYAVAACALRVSFMLTVVTPDPTVARWSTIPTTVLAVGDTW